MLEREEMVLRLLAKHSSMFTCSFETAYKKWMTDDEKDGFSYDYIVLDYMANT